MANVQLAVAGDETTQVILSVPGVQGPAGSNLPPSGTTHQLLYKQSNTNYDTAWKLITNDNVDAAAAIAGTKISPNFGSQNVLTTGTSTAASFIPSSSSVPANGLYLPAANSVALSTNGTGRLFVDANGAITIGASSTGFYISPLTGSSAYLATDSASTAADFVFGTSTSIPIRFIANNTERLRITSAGLVGVGTSSPSSALDVSGAISLGTVAIPSAGTARLFSRNTDSNLYIQTGSGNNLYLLDGSQNTMAGFGSSSVFFNTGNTTRLTIDSSGRVGIGTSSPSTFGAQLAVIGGSVHADRTIGGGAAQVQFSMGASSGANFGQIGNTGTRWSLGYGATANTIGTEVLVWDSSGRVGIGTTTVSSRLHVLNLSGGSSTAEVSTVERDNSGYFLKLYRNAGSGNTGGLIGADSAGTYYTGGHNTQNMIYIDAGNGVMQFYTNNDERARIDSSGRLLVGTSSDSQASTVTVQGNSSSATGGAIFRMRIGTATPADGNTTGVIKFEDNSGGTGAEIEARRDGGTWSGSSKPSRLVFSTTADGASSPTSRLVITSTGAVVAGGTNTSEPSVNSTTNFNSLGNTGYIIAARSAGTPLFVGRNTDDGALVEFRQDGTVEGTISVSGTTVSYNGAHLSRWSQLPSGQNRTEILRGSVLSNIDEMCEWDDEDNEQLNRMKVSDVEGDKNVAGVFQAWDDDDDTYTNDFYCAMTGDFVIRIAAGITVERGDLLMSAGDGTAKPQDDDIIRSKTIAKVTSTNVTCTYEDGSYCVPCVLMAC